MTTTASSSRSSFDESPPAAERPAASVYAYASQFLSQSILAGAHKEAPLFHSTHPNQAAMSAMSEQHELEESDMFGGLGLDPFDIPEQQSAGWKVHKEADSPASLHHPHNDEAQSEESDELLTSLAQPHASKLGPTRISHSVAPRPERAKRTLLVVENDATQPASATRSKRRRLTDQGSLVDAKPQDSIWLALYLSSVTVVAMITIWAYLFATAPYSFTLNPSAKPSLADEEVQEASALLSVLPLLTTMTLLAIAGTAAAMASLLVVQHTIRKAVYGFLGLGPAALVFLAFYGWGSSASAGGIISDDGEARTLPQSV